MSGGEGEGERRGRGEGERRGEGGAEGGDGGGGEGRSEGRDLAVRWVVRGRVQGVGFRYYVRTHARELGLAGRVRNLPGGEVEIEAGGPAGKVRELEARIRQGPPGAAVAGLAEHALSAAVGAAAAARWGSRFDIDRYEG
jgi:acylphosphatase